MPMDTNLFYGIMVGSAGLHAVIPLIVGVILSMTTLSLQMKMIVMLVLIVALSFLVQSGLLTALQANSCNGVKSYRNIFVGASIGSLITLIMAAIPIFIEPLRLVVSQMFVDHKPLLTPELARINQFVTKAAVDFSEITGAPESEPVSLLTTSTPTPTPPVQTGGAALDPEQYESQTLRETQTAAAYWTAFAGAYGIAIGSIMAATTCPSA